jgi:methylmalonyl-CoA mutase N-terminal domain/subunit
VFRSNPALEPAQRQRLAAVRASRDGGAVSRELGSLEVVARGEGNLVPPIVDAVRARASVGEISDVLRRVFGSFDQHA